MSAWEADGQIYERISGYDVTRSGWCYELQALRGKPGDGPSILAFVPDDDPSAAVLSWHGSVRTIPLAIIRRFLDEVPDSESSAITHDDPAPD